MVQKYPGFFADRRNLWIIVCADGINPFNDQLSSIMPICFTIGNLPGEERHKHVFTYGIAEGKPKDTSLFYDHLVDELEVLWSTGHTVFDIIEKKPFKVRCMVYAVLMDYVGLVDASRRMAATAIMGCMKCLIAGIGSAKSKMGKTIFLEKFQKRRGPPILGCTYSYR